MMTSNSLSDDMILFVLQMTLVFQKIVNKTTNILKTFLAAVSTGRENRDHGSSSPTKPSVYQLNLGIVQISARRISDEFHINDVCFFFESFFNNYVCSSKRQQRHRIHECHTESNGRFVQTTRGCTRQFCFSNDYGTFRESGFANTEMSFKAKIDRVVQLQVLKFANSNIFIDK